MGDAKAHAYVYKQSFTTDLFELQPRNSTHQILDIVYSKNHLHKLSYTHRDGQAHTHTKASKHDLFKTNNNFACRHAENAMKISLNEEKRLIKRYNHLARDFCCSRTRF